MNTTTETITPARWLAEQHITMACEFVPVSQSRDPGSLTLNWRCTIFAGSWLNASMTTPYTMGCGHIPGHDYTNRSVAYADKIRAACETGKWNNAPLPEPALADVMHCLIMDGATILNTGSFEEWAEALGFSIDSLSAYRAYRQCLEQTLQLRRLIDIERAAQAFEDY